MCRTPEFPQTAQHQLDTHRSSLVTYTHTPYILTCATRTTFVFLNYKHELLSKHSSGPFMHSGSVFNPKTMSIYTSSQTHIRTDTATTCLTANFALGGVFFSLFIQNMVATSKMMISQGIFNFFKLRGRSRIANLIHKWQVIMLIFMAKSKV